MKSKTSLFNRTIILNMLRRYWVMFAAYFSVMGGTVLITLLNALQSNLWHNHAGVPHYGSFFEFLQYIPNISIVISFFAAPVAAAILFSYLYNARHTGLMGSLPVTRESMYLSVSAAGMIGFTLCNLVILLLGLVLEIAYGDVSLAGLGMALLMMTLSMCVFYGIAVFCCMLTGNIFAGPAVYVVFNFLTIGAEALIVALLKDVVFGLSNGYIYKTTFLCPMIQLGETLNFDMDFVYDPGDLDTVLSYSWEMEGLGILAIYALVGLVFLWLGLRLYKNRRMETAGDTIAIEVLKPVFRLCMAVGGGLLFANFIKEALYHITPTQGAAAAYTAVLLSIGGVVGYFVGQMLIAKSVNVFRKGWKSVGLYVLSVAVLVTAVECDLFGYERRVPDPEDVDNVYVTIFDGNNAVTFEEPENIHAAVQLHANIIANKAFHEIELGGKGSALPVDSDPGAAFCKQTVQFSYELKSGDMLVRRYSLSYDPDAIRNSNSEIRVLEALLNTDEAIAARCIAPFAVTSENTTHCSVEWVDKDSFERFDFHDFSPSDIATLYNECILPDIADGRLGTYNIIENEAYARSKYRCNIYLEVYQEEVNSVNGNTFHNYFTITLYVTTDASRTLAYLEELGIRPATVYDYSIHSGYDFTDLGRYRIDGTDEEPSKYYDGEMTAVSYAVIGGADGPTEVFVTR